MKFRNKKADMSARKMIFYAVFGFTLIIAFFLIVKMFFSDKSAIAEIPTGLEDFLIIQRFFNSELCFTYKEEATGRILKRVIDTDRFNQEKLDACFDAIDSKTKAYRLSLKYESQEKTIQTKNWQGFLKKTELHNVTVYDKGFFKPAEFFIEIENAR